MHATALSSGGLFDEEMSLPNLTKLEADMKALRASSSAVHLICYDLDSLRKINYTYGRKAGDQLIRVIGVWAAMSLGGTLYRIDGDSFCLVLVGKTLAQAQELCERACRRAYQPWHIRTQGRKLALYVTASLCLIPMTDSLFEQNLPNLVERTLDIARTKRSVVVYDAATDRRQSEHIQLQMDLRNCLLENMRGFSLCYQPIVEPTTGQWKGVEALCRFRSSNWGAVSPAMFIPEIESQGLMHLLGHWVLETAIAHCTSLGLHEKPGFFLSVNASSSQFLRRDFAHSVIDLVREYGFPPEKLNLEITESMEFAFTDDAMAIIGELRAQGITLALDDFGTGYSTFRNMQSLPCQFVKTERALIQAIDRDTYQQYSLRVISQTAHAGGMRLIAEGIETAEQLAAAINSGADLIQGYYFSHPLTGNELKLHRTQFGAAE